MSITATDILTISEALKDRWAGIATVDEVIPSPFYFPGKEDFFATLDPSIDTKEEIETELIRAVWIRYLRFEDDDRDIEAPVKTLIFEYTIFHEASYERLDETETPDAFNELVSKTNHEHVASVFAIVAAFQGVVPLTGLGSFAVAETNSLAQIDNTESLVQCEFVPGANGHQTKLEARVRLQMPC